MGKLNRADQGAVQGVEVEAEAEVKLSQTLMVSSIWTMILCFTIYTSLHFTLILRHLLAFMLLIHLLILILHPLLLAHHALYVLLMLLVVRRLILMLMV
jgi:hypothetical protein